MKARIKATGEIVDVTRIVDRYVMTHHPHTITFEKDELDFGIEDDIDYWTRLEHQAAITAMQGVLSNPNLAYKDISTEIICNHVAERLKEIAHALVEKYKKEK